MSDKDSAPALQKAIDGYNDAWNRQDLDAIVAMHAPDMVFENHTAGECAEGADVRAHIARESRSFIVAPSHFQRASSYPDDFPLRELLAGVDVIGRGGSAILAPDGSYLAGPLYDREGILYARLDPAVLHAERQRFDPAGHYHRPDVFRLELARPV